MPEVSVSRTERTAERSFSGRARTRATASSTRSSNRRSAPSDWCAAHARTSAATSAGAPAYAARRVSRCRRRSARGTTPVSATVSAVRASRYASPIGSRTPAGKIFSERWKLRLTCRSRSSSPSFKIEGSARGVGRILGFLEAFLELSVEQLALLGLGLHLLAEAFFALRRLRPQRVERGAEVLGRAGRGRGLVGDHGLQLGIDGELALAARTGDHERLAHGG